MIKEIKERDINVLEKKTTNQILLFFLIYFFYKDTINFWKSIIYLKLNNFWVFLESNNDYIEVVFLVEYKKTQIQFKTIIMIKLLFLWYFFNFFD